MTGDRAPDDADQNARLLAFFEARLDEEETAANAATKGPWLIDEGDETPDHSLTIKGGPVWLDQYETKAHQLGDELLALRGAFLSAKRVRDAYLGYATQQFRKLLSHGRFGSDIPDRRTSKHARHLKRLVDQGFELYTTGRLTIRLLNPQTYFDFGEQVAADPQSAVPFMATAEDRFNTARTVLPDNPQSGAVEAWVRSVRRAHYESDGGPQ